MGKESKHLDPGPDIVDEALMRRHVRKCLLKLKQESFFVEGFDKKDFDELLGEDGTPPSPTDHNHVFNRLLAVVAKSIVGTESIAGKSKRKKMVLQQLQSHRDKWVEEIRNFDSQTVENEMDDMDVANSTSDHKELDSDTTELETTKKKKKKKKKKKGKVLGKRKSQQILDEDIPENDDRKDAPADGSGEKPKKRRKSGSKTKKGKDLGKSEEPVPEAIEETVGVRLSRQEMKEKFEAEKKEILDSLPDDVRLQFREVGFTKWKSSILPVMFLGPYDVHPGPLRDKWMEMYENTKNRRHQMSRLVYWYGEINMDVAFSFVPKSSCLTYEEGVAKGKDKLPKAIQKKVDANKKLTKNDKLVIDGLKEFKADVEKDPADRKKPLGDIQEDYELIEFVEEAATPETGIAGNSDGAHQKMQDQGMNKVDEMDFVEDEVSSGEAYDESEVSEDDEADLDYEEPGVTKTSRKRKDPAVASKPKKSAAKKAKIDRKRTKKLSKSKQREKQESASYKREQEKFEDCENLYLPLEQRWKLSLEAKDAEKLAGVMDELSAFVDSLSAAFIESYKLPQMMKETKPILKGSDADSGVYKKVWNAMKELYKAGKEKIPTGFVAVKRKKKVEVPKNTGNKSRLGNDEQRGTGHPIESDDRPVQIIEANGDKFQDETKIDTTESTPAQISTRIPRFKDVVAVTDSPHRYQESSQSGMGSPSQAGNRSKQVKSERKAFSLGHLIRPKKAADSQDSASGLRTDRTLSAGKNTTPDGPPLWLTTPPETDSSLSLHEERLFALEFLESAAAQFPKGTANPTIAARSLEDEIFKWSKRHGDADWIESYWEKVHALVAAICGKTNKGLIIKDILSGKYPAARDLVLESDDVLKWSFGE